MSDKMFPWSLAILPMGTDRRTHAGFHSLGITSESKQSDKVWRLLRYLTCELEDSLAFNRVEGNVLVLRAVDREFEQRWHQLVPGSRPEVQTGAIQKVYSGWLGSGAYAGEFVNTLFDMARGVFDGRQSAYSALTSGARRMRALLQQR